MMPPGALELVIILAVVLLFFGSKKLPELARGLGKSITNFKSGLKEEESETETAAQQEKETPQKEEVS